MRALTGRVELFVHCFHKSHVHAQFLDMYDIAT